MIELTVNKFRMNIKTYVDKSITDHIPLKVKRKAGKDFVVLSAEDWERDQETIYVLQNDSLMEQIDKSVQTHHKKSGYKPAKEEIDEINSI